MSKASKADGSSSQPPEKSTVILLLGSIADTSWRMFVPALIGIVGGYFLDQMCATKPWLFLGGTILGCTIAGLLVKRQLEKYD